MRAFVSIALVTGLLALVGGVGTALADQSPFETYCYAESDPCPGTYQPVSCEGELTCTSSMRSVECDGVETWCPYVECIPGAFCRKHLDCGTWGACDKGTCICIYPPPPYP